MRKKRSGKKKRGVIVVTSVLILAALTSAVFAYLYTENKSSRDIIDEGVYIGSINMGGKKLSEVGAILKDKYTAEINTKNISVKGTGTYTLNYAKLKAKYNIDEALQEALDYKKAANIFESFKNRKKQERKNFKLKLSYSHQAVDEFVDMVEKEENRTASAAKISVVNGNINITPEVDGVTLRKDKLKGMVIDAIENTDPTDKVVIEAPVDIKKPSITTDMLKSIDTCASSFGTNFSTSISNRINNIELAVKAINGTLLMPGESFSFNEIVGERTIERGYKEAGVIIGDKIESGVGGGICQVSSTLYNAVLAANLKVDERRNHTLPLSYISMGLDATVDFGNIDFKFENSLDVPIYIEGYTKNKNVYFSIYTNNKFINRTYKIYSQIYGTVQPDIKYIDDPNKEEGYNEVVKSPSNGYKVKVYRNTYENGKIIATEQISNDYYSAIEGQVIKGTKKPMDIKE